ncbi:MAG: arginine--tRNA ligase [Planctomycetes bacterium]|jgi:arginyl-tRNA synthetase|nr:arginine--tRNA ligase [Planctomycetota bacterium]
MPTTPYQHLADAFGSAIVAVLGPDFAGSDPVIRVSTKPEFGDYQCNASMGLAKQTGRKPRELAAELIEVVDVADIAEQLEVAGPGFINITLKTSTIATALESMDTPALGVKPNEHPEIVVIDMCGVNVAKQMHVGHLRSTIIGDAFARILTRLGDDVHRENHLGDWGLPVALVLHLLRTRGVDLTTLTLGDLDAAYRDAQALAKADQKGLTAAISKQSGPHRIAELEDQNTGAADIRSEAGQTLVALQQGDEDLVRDWNSLISVTTDAMSEALNLLGVQMTKSNNRGESFYRDRLRGVLDWFESQGLCRKDDGAVVVDFDDRERPLLIQKSDGGFLYATTDLAAVRVRTEETGAGRCIYVVDSRQRDHFKDVFDAATLAGWCKNPSGKHVVLSHTGFGSVLGPDRRPLKTRSGENATLASLLKEAISRGRAEVHSRAEDPNAPTHGLSQVELDAIGQAVGIGAVKYADLANDLVRDYVFDLDRMVAFEGDTGPYLQYAHARIRSVVRRAESFNPDAAFLIEQPAERGLSLTMLRWNDVVHAAAESLEPHRIAAYLREVAEDFNGFYQTCPVLKAPTPELRESRLRLADLAGRVLEDGLGLLGIDAPACM